MGSCSKIKKSICRSRWDEPKPPETHLGEIVERVGGDLNGEGADNGLNIRLVNREFGLAHHLDVSSTVNGDGSAIRSEKACETERREVRRQAAM